MLISFCRLNYHSPDLWYSCPFWGRSLHIPTGLEDFVGGDDTGGGGCRGDVCRSHASAEEGGGG